MKSKHIGERKRCKVCNKVCPNTQRLKIHALIHEETKRFRCLSCGDSFNDYKKLSLHMKKSHRLEKLITCICDFCGTEYYSKLRLSSHMRCDHFGAYKCFDQICGKKFVCLESRRKHYLNVHNHTLEVMQIFISV